MSDVFPQTDRNRIRRYPERGRYDKETVYTILDAALVGHVAFVRQGSPAVIPTLYARRDDHILLHGAPSSGLMRHLAAGGEIAMSVAVVDGLVVTKTAADLSVNYRSVVVFGRGRLLRAENEKRAALRVLTERLIPGQWNTQTEPPERAIRGVAVAEIAIESASAKVRRGMPNDPPPARDLPAWAGYIPIRLTFGEPIAADYASAPLPPALAAYIQSPALSQPQDFDGD